MALNKTDALDAEDIEAEARRSSPRRSRKAGARDLGASSGQRRAAPLLGTELMRLRRRSSSAPTDREGAGVGRRGR